MTRAYIRLDPAFDENKEAYPDGPYAALVATFCLAEAQPMRGRFRSAAYLKALLGKRGRHLAYLIDHGDIELLPDGRLYVVGWDEWQEGDWKVGERVARIRARDRQAGAQRTAKWRLRKQILERDRFCRYCGDRTYPADDLVLEHVVPVTRGGPTDEGNLVAACRPCNRRKGNRLPIEAGMSLLAGDGGDASLNTFGTVRTGSLDLSEVSAGGDADKALTPGRASGKKAGLKSLGELLPGVVERLTA